MLDSSTSTGKLRYRWSHRHPLHRAVVRGANRLLPWVPFPIKYAVTDRVRRDRPPYALLGPDSVAVQVGAPRDTLLAGRSRAMAFARRTGPAGRLLIVEPDRDSVQEFRKAVRRHGLRHVEVVNAAAWHERGSLTIKIDTDHPATNFTAGRADYSEADLRRFRDVTVNAVPIDDLVDEIGLARVDLVSITTNGAEEEILRGLRRTLERDHPVLCLAHRSDRYSRIMTTLGYDVLSDDDRGFTFRPL